MMGRKLIALAAALALTGATFTASAARPQPAAAAPAAQVLQLRFAPPLDKPLRFRVTSDQTGDDVSVAQELTFRRDGGGFVMAVKWLSMTVEGQTFDITAKDSPLPPTMRLMFAPMEVELDASGNMIRVRNWTDFVKRMRDTAPELAEAIYSNPAERKEFADFFAKFIAQFEKVSAEDATDLVLTGWPTLFRMMGVTGPAGEPVRSQIMVQTAFVSGRVPYGFTTTLSLSDNAQLLHVSAKGVPSEAVHEQLVDGLVAMAIASLPPGDEKADPKNLRRLFGDLEVGTTLEANFDPKTGLPIKAQIGTVLFMGGRDKSYTLVIEAL